MATAKDRLGDTTRPLHGLAEEYEGLAGEHLGAPVALIRGQDAAEAARGVHQRLRRVLDIPVLVTAASVPRGTEPLGRGVTVASRCCRLLRGLGVREGGTTTEQLAMYTILFDPDRDRDLDAFLDHSLGRLVAHDAERGTDLVGTLAAYFANARNPAGTARVPHIHTNTLLKRIDRIGSLLGHNWQQPDHTPRLHLAVHLHELARQVEQAE
ncbi:PucR family transcriptional regulator [Streptomyces sp. NPDC001617]